MGYITQKDIISIVKLIRNKKHPSLVKPWDPDIPDIYFEEFLLNNQPYNLPMVVLKTKPCSWYKSSGGCTTCGYHLAGAGVNQVEEQNLINQTRVAIESLRPLSRFPLIHLLSAGSFLDSHEIPDEICVKIIKMFTEAGIHSLTTESLPEFIDEPKLKAIREIVPEHLMIGIGLETINDEVRALCVNKSFKKKLYETKIHILKDLNISFANHVLLGKPFLTVRDDLNDVIETIRYSISVGAEITVLMVANLQPNTLTHWLWLHHLYNLPKLWAPLQALLMLDKNEREHVVVKGFDKMVPEPIAYASNCPNCTDKIGVLIEKWNQTRDFKFIQKSLNLCDCRKDWFIEMSNNVARDDYFKEVYDALIKSLEIL